MKLKNKLPISIFLLGIVFISAISIIHYYQNHNLAVKQRQLFSLEIVKEFALSIEEHLAKDAQVTSTLANAPIIEQALTHSNSEFAVFNEQERIIKISALNKKWMGINDSNDPFIQKYLTSPVATYLEKQQKTFPEFYGEIFLTNRYGVLIATTKKLTTLAHAHKYWWKGSYYEGKGRTFFDDRGYDESVKGYVLGVVVPVKKDGEIIGMLKCNINILGSYSGLLNKFTENNVGALSLVRSKGLIVFKKGVEPLSKKIPDVIIEKMKTKPSNSLVSISDGVKQIIAYSPVSITKGTEEYGFGGKNKPIDHQDGNLREKWFVLFAQDLKEAIVTSERLDKEWVFGAIILVILMALSALILGRSITKPIVKLVKSTKTIGKGDFDSKVEISSKDELGDLAKSFNHMIIRLKETTTSKNKLLKEIELRENLETKIIQSEEEYRLLFTQMSSGFALHEMIYDDSGTPIDYRFLKMNPAFEAQTGLEIEKLIGKTAFEVLPKTEQYLIETYGNVDLTGESTHFEYYASALNKYFEITAYSSGKNKFACLFRDITEKKIAELERQELEEKLRQAHKMEALGTLSGGIAHDFNNLLAAILGYAEMAQDDVPDDHPAKDSIEQVLTAGNRAKEIVKQILSFSRKEITEKVPLQLDILVNETLALLRATIPTTIEIRPNITPACGPVLANPNQIHQVLMNLCTNSAHALDETGGVIEVSLDTYMPDRDTIVSGVEDKKYIRLTIEDNGTGIDNKIQGKIFDPYFTTKEVGKGSGMGLSVVTGIVKSHDGTLTVDSKLGEGTTFTVYFPMVDESIQHNRRLNDPNPTGSERILIVDDDTIVIGMTKRMVERLGYQVTTQTSSADALNLFRSQPDAYDLVISDQTMPELTGEKLAKKLREIRPNIPIIICSGYSSKMDAEKAKHIGISAFVMKPFENKELSLVIRKVLDEKNNKLG